jgi:nicotinamide-nucleotide amidase
VITTGGLGSTHDDITKFVLADLFQCHLVPDEKVSAQLEAIFKQRGRQVPENVWMQREVPDKAEILYNEKGTAPGLLFRKNGKSVFALPGVPLEMEHLFGKYILPELAKLNSKCIRHRILKTTGVSEAALWEKVGSLDPLLQTVTVASLPSHLGVRVRLSVVADNEEEAKQALEQAERWMEERAGNVIYGCDDETLEDRVGQLLLDTKQTLAVAESCTGGLIGHRLTAVSGSSEYFLESAVTYSNAAKAARLGVDREKIACYGAVSEEVAQAMAEGIRKTSGADIGIATTGIAGPTGGSEEKPVGLTFIALSDRAGTWVEKFNFHQDRTRNKERAAQAALNLLRLRLTGEAD